MDKRIHKPGRYSGMLLFLLSGAVAPAAQADRDSADVEFDPVFLNTRRSGSVDLSRFNRGMVALPGRYHADIYLNHQQIGSEMIEIRERGEGSVYPCMTTAILSHFDPAAWPAAAPDVQACPDLTAYLPDAQVTFDSGEQRLDVVAAQKYVLRQPRGTISPALWDRGIPALLLGYNMNGYSSDVSGTNYRSFYAGLNGGFNFGAWYLRHNGNYSWRPDNAQGYQSINTYLQRDIPALSARFLAGQSNTNGALFDTLPFSGVQLASDERMLAESQRGYAPEIRGVARTNARVDVEQGGQTVYEITVPPGEFVINDLYPTGYGGDLRVSVREADGSTQVFTVPYASLAQLLRPGAQRYSLTAGKLRSTALRDEPAFYQATYQRGLSNAVTGYGGVQASEDYAALQLGASFATPAGALAFDVTHADTTLPDERQGETRSRGQSYRLSFSKAVPATGSNLSLAAYRFSTRNYMDFMTAMQTRDALRRGYPVDGLWRARNRFTLTMGQALPANMGQLYASASLQNYWERGGYQRQFQVGYTNSFRSLTYNLNVNRSQSGDGKTQDTYMLSFSVPLGRDTVNTPQMRLEMTHDTQGRSRMQSALSGSAGEDGAFSYGASLTQGNQGEGGSAAVNGQYRGRWAQTSASYSQGKNYRSASAGLSGTLLAHSGGLTLTPYNGDTFALVEAQGAAGARVSSYPGIRIDGRGYAAVPYLNPYQMNEISIDPKGMSQEVELQNTTQKVAPYSGAVVKLRYHTERGVPLLIFATYQGEPLAFGAEIFDGAGKNVGAVGQAGQAFARVTQPRGQLHVRWGDNAAMRCLIDYDVTASQQDTPATPVSVCRKEEM